MALIHQRCVRPVGLGLASVTPPSTTVLFGAIPAGWSPTSDLKVCSSACLCSIGRGWATSCPASLASSFTSGVALSSSGWSSRSHQLMVGGKGGHLEILRRIQGT